MKSLKYKLNRKSLEIFYSGFIRPILEYGDILFAGSDSLSLEKINKIEREAKRISTGATARCNSQLLDIESKWENITDRRKIMC